MSTEPAAGQRYPIPKDAFWAKRRPRHADPTDWHPLASHCLDVAACCEALLYLPNIRAKLSRLANTTEWPEAWTARLVTLAMLHDFGKANIGFQQQSAHAGHIVQASALIYGSKQFCATGLGILTDWGIDPRELLAVTLAHHGQPPDLGNPPQMEFLWTKEAILGVRGLVDTA
ncbi:MAG: CRISPR-associated endonuclease Cas3'', partial [Hyphomicrobiaceae bacterium]